MRFDDILAKIGEFGPYQWRAYIIVCLMAIPMAMHQMAQVFLAGKPEHWCNVAEWEDVDCGQWNLTGQECEMAKRDASVPVNGTETDTQCRRYVGIGDVAFYPGLDPTEYDGNLTSCDDGWVYDQSQYKSSIIQDFDLVCDDKNLPNLAQSLFFVGVLVGSVFFGALSDIIGRYFTIFICLGLQATLGVGVAFSPNYWTFTILRMFLGAANMGVFLMGFVIGTEFVGPSKRTVAGIVIEIFFSFGYMLLALYAYFVREWWKLQLVISVPIFAFVVFIPILPESVRWLISRGRTDEAVKIIRKSAEVNEAKLPEPIFTEEEIKEQEAAAHGSHPTALDLFRTPNLRIRTINLMFNWFVNTLVYYGLSLSTSDLGTNDYVAFFISGAVEVPAYISCIFAIDYFGRKWSIFGYMIGGGAACLITIFTPLGPWRTTVAMIGKFGISASFAIVYIFSAEIFPTPVRSVGVGLCSMSARVGGIIAPIILILEEYWAPLPVMIFGISSIIAALLALFLPETLGCKLPETIEEGEAFGKKTAGDIEISTIYRPRSSSMDMAGHSNGTGLNGSVNAAYEKDVEKCHE